MTGFIFLQQCLFATQLPDLARQTPGKLLVAEEADAHGGILPSSITLGNEVNCPEFSYSLSAFAANSYKIETCCPLP